MPQKARWGYIGDELHKNVADGLNKALAALEEHNQALAGVLTHIDFNRQVGRSRIPDVKLRELIKHFSRYRLRNEDFVFPDLLGAAYEYLIAEFADFAGKKGSEFYTPREVVQLMVRLLKLEAVIGLPPNLFYGTGIPACILVMRSKGAKPAERRGQVLFINADAEYYAGRAQNYLRPEHIEKIAFVFERFESFDGYSAVVSKEQLKENDYNCNIRRYADNAPPPEPQDVKAHLLGGIPKTEVEAK